MFSMLAENTERAMAHCNSDSVLLVGWVGWNGGLLHVMRSGWRVRYFCMINRR